MDNTIIRAEFKRTKFVTTEAQWRFNHGQRLVFSNVDLPPHYQVHFSNTKNGSAKTVLGDENGVLIPQEFFVPGQNIYAWLYVQDATSGVTIRQVTIPVDQKAKPIDQTPSPDQVTVIDQAIEELNIATESMNHAVDTVNERIDASLQEAKDSGEFNGSNGLDGLDGSTIWTYIGTPITPNYTFYKYLMRGTPDAVQKENDLILYGTKLYRIIHVYDNTVLADFYIDLKSVDNKSRVWWGTNISFSALPDQVPVFTIPINSLRGCSGAPTVGDYVFGPFSNTWSDEENKVNSMFYISALSATTATLSLISVIGRVVIKCGITDLDQPDLTGYDPEIIRALAPNVVCKAYYFTSPDEILYLPLVYSAPSYLEFSAIINNQIVSLTYNGINWNYAISPIPVDE